MVEQVVWAPEAECDFLDLDLPLEVFREDAQEEEESEEMSSTETSSCLRFQLLWHMVR